jgi:hypothetical protein
MIRNSEALVGLVVLMGQATLRLDPIQDALAVLEAAGKVPLPIPALILDSPAREAAFTRFVTRDKL